MAPLPDPFTDAVDTAALADRLADPRAELYFTGNGHRLAATRALLDLLDLPLPHWAERNPSGRAAVTKAAMARFKADNPDDNLPRGYVPPKAR